MSLLLFLSKPKGASFKSLQLTQETEETQQRRSRSLRRKCSAGFWNCRGFTKALLVLMLSVPSLWKELASTTNSPVGQQITQAVSIPVIGDGDNGYGNAMNVKRTVKGYIRAVLLGFYLKIRRVQNEFLGVLITFSIVFFLNHYSIHSCILCLLETNETVFFMSPKACGHTQGRKVVSREEAVMRIKAAVDARKESGSDIVIVARSDSRQEVSLDEALWRSGAFADAGADVLFIDALASKEEMKALCGIYPLVPKMANMLEGGGKTPILNPFELEDVG
ncbi:hypothetical protein M0R45_019874 [Rubus argutus]|uniref:Uncharacterized protein n=1 Tax=Rubus argutus TaxID=59490 RepID=A0AAW1X6S7_RUBAR